MEDILQMGQLENGVHYYIRKTDLQTDLVYLVLSVKVGSFQDGFQKGIAHLLEHCNMSLEKYQRNPFSFCYRGRAYTNHYSTNYIFAFQKEGIGDVFDRLQRLLLGEFLNPDQLSEIKQDIRKEWQKKEENMDYQGLKLFFEDTDYLLFLPIGKMDLVSGLSFEEVEQFFFHWYTPERMAVLLVGDVSFEWIEKIKKLKFQCGTKRKLDFLLTPVSLSGKKLPEVEKFVPKNGTFLHYFFIVEWKAQMEQKQYIKENFHYDFCHDVIVKAFDSQKVYGLGKKGCQCNFFAPLQELFYFSAKKETYEKGESIGQIRAEIASFVLNYFEENFEKMKKEYRIALQNYKDYIDVQEMMNQCTDHYIYGNKLIDCNQEKEVLSRYINEIEKTKVKNILEEILWEGAIRYVEREGGLEIDHCR